MRISALLNKMIRHGWTLALLGGLLATASCRARETVSRKHLSVMDTVATLEAPRKNAKALPAASLVMEDFGQRIWPMVDVYNPHSQISRANNIGGRHRFPISTDVYRIVEYAQRLTDMTGGAFDVTDAPLRVLWQQHWANDPNSLLPETLVQAFLPRTSASLIDIEPQSLTYRSTDTQLDVNDLARAYLLDLTIVQLRRQGFSPIRIGMDSTTRVLGGPTPNDTWSIPVYHPKIPDEVIGHIHIPDSHAWSTCPAGPLIVTPAGRFNRAIHPRTGMPARDIIFTAVLAPVAMEAFALSRALAALPLEDGANLVAGLPRHHAMIIQDADPLDIFVSPGLVPFFRPAPAHAGSIRTGL